MDTPKNPCDLMLLLWQLGIVTDIALIPEAICFAWWRQHKKDRE